ncbi:hypothetical protein ATCC90586_003838 [Pythium insidiosum]|nr:hypothetical protein ATCC90586_003838 [Pythium insidiosum]
MAGDGVSTAGKYEETPLHIAARDNAVEAAKALITAGADIEATNWEECTPLHKAAFNGATETAIVLLAANARVDAVDQQAGETPLHKAALVDAPGVAKALIAAGARVDAVNSDGMTPLMLAIDDNSDSVERRLRILQLLMAGGAALPPHPGSGSQAVSSNWEVASCWAEQRELGVELVQLPIEVYERGPNDIRAYFKSLVAQPPALDKQRKKAAARRDRRGSSAPRADHRPNIDENTDEVAAHHRRHSSVPRADYRSKICVVGPSTWGKTSFIKSFVRGEATLEEADVRTVGIDLYSWCFDIAETARYNVTLWDFAGQDEYQSAHSLFFSRRTLYVMCVNLKAYADALHSADGDDDPEALMNQFVDAHIIKWIRVICAHYPAACFVFVGTKADLIGHDPTKVRAISDDLQHRLRRSEQDIVDALERELVALRRERQHSEARRDPKDDLRLRIQALEALRSQRPRFLSAELLVVSSADLSGMQQMQRRLEDFIAESDTGFLMPPIYSQLHRYLHDKARLAVDSYVTDGKVSALVNSTFLSVSTLFEQVTTSSAFQAVSMDELAAMLHVFHDLGDVLWYDRDPESSLAKTVFLSPSVVIDFVRCVVNHTLGRPEHAKTKLEKDVFPLIQSEGRVKHKLIERLDMWKDVSRETMLQLKELLWLFQLAYPHSADGMKWDSDLVIPLYWKRESEVATAISPPAGVISLHWEYVFRVYLPDNLFERFCVQNYAISASCDRKHTRDWYVLSNDDVMLEVLVHKRDVSIEGDSFLAVAISVTAQSTEIAWRELVMFCMSMERLLETYPGLWVSRSVVSSRGRRFDVDELVRERLEHDRAACESGSSAATTSPLLPPDISWYTQRRWRERTFTRVVNTPNDSVLQQIREDIQCIKQGQARVEQGQERVETKIVAGFEQTALLQEQTRNALMNMFAGATNRRLFPALWTLETEPHASTKTMTLRIRIRSDLSGMCFHEPLSLTVGDATIAKYGSFIQAGLSVFSCVVPDFLGKGVVEAIASECQKQIERTMAVHNLIDGLRLPHRGSADIPQSQVALSPDATLSLFVDLLRLVVADRGRVFDPLQMAELSGLECGYVTATGDYVWAHYDELLNRSADIQLAHKSTGDVATSADNAPALSMLVNGTETPRLQPLKPVPSAQQSSEPQMLSLRIVEVRGLRKGKSLGAQSPYCKWTLSADASAVIASGRTEPHKNGGVHPKWSSQTFAIRLPPQSSLKNLQLVVTVMCAGVVAAIKTTLGEGSLDLSPLLVDGKLVKQSIEHCIRLIWKGSLAGEMIVTLE